MQGWRNHEPRAQVSKSKRRNDVESDLEKSTRRRGRGKNGVTPVSPTFIDDRRKRNCDPKVLTSRAGLPIAAYKDEIVGAFDASNVLVGAYFVVFCRISYCVLCLFDYCFYLFRI